MSSLVASEERTRHPVIVIGSTAPASGIVSFSSRRVQTHGSRSLWLQETLDGREPYEHPRFEGTAETDVCIVGGGFTGLWTALELKRRAPDTNVTLVEADICGAGASGRNGGFALTWWAHFEHLVSLCGPEPALALARRAEAAVKKIGEFCQERGIEDAFQLNGWVWAATNPSQVGSWEQPVKLLQQFGAEPYRQLSRRELTELTGSPQHLDGLFEPVSAAVQPAKIARELSRAVREAGVTVYERAQVRAIEYGPHTSVVLDGGSITTDQVVLAVNAWAAQIHEIGAGLVVMASDVIATTPAPERVAEAGIKPGVCISDGRRLVNYYHATADGRLVFGKGGGTLAFKNRITAEFDHPGRREAPIRSQLLRTYPSLWDVPMAESWSGPIDYSLSGLPFFVRLREAPSVLVCAGFSGDGVGPSRLAGEILAEMAADGGNAGLPGALRTVPTRRLPPEPVRYVGGRLVRAAIARKEQSEDLGAKPKLVDRLLAGLDPTGYDYQGPKRAA
ncbi:MAG TPA: FAD-dependent oxidoreductase [Solirubrobacteraceae bacterium]|nr:FAD-dependent oxidoreductase [Solirubrobacteraceae bacterium]